MTLTVAKTAMATELLTVTDGGIRLDAFVSQSLDISRGLAAELIDSGNVLLNGKKTKKSASVAKDDKITVEMPQLSEPEAVPQDIPLNIVYEDDDLLVVD